MESDTNDNWWVEYDDETQAEEEEYDEGGGAADEENEEIGGYSKETLWKAYKLRSQQAK